MSSSEHSGPVEQPLSQAVGSAPELGLSAVELAAKRGIGPLSLLGEGAWHGEAKPCVSCGQLVRRSAQHCDQCGQELSPQMLVRMQAHCGPWYVHEHVRPFPGVTLERLVRQAKRGVLTATTIVRGPTTYHQWRFAAETPGLSKHVGMCWRCQASVAEDDTACPICRVNLDGETDVLFEQTRPEAVQSGQPATTASARSDDVGSTPGAERRAELGQLGAAVSRGAPPKARATPGPATVVGVPVQWVVTALVLLLVIAIYVVVHMRAGQTARDEAEPSRALPAHAIDAKQGETA